MKHTVLIERRAPAPELQQRYQHFNSLLFGGELPTIPIYWDALTSAGGKVQFKVKYDSNQRTDPAHRALSIRLGLQSKYQDYAMVPDSLFMVITNLYQRDQANLDGILVHEMIHVFFATVEPRFGEQHGMHFMRKLRELEAKVDFKIPVTDAVKDLALADTAKLKTVYVVWAKMKASGTTSFMFLPSKYATDEALRTTVHITLATYMGRVFSDVKIVKLASPVWTKVAFRAVLPRTFSVRLFQAKALPPDAIAEAEAAPEEWAF